MTLTSALQMPTDLVGQSLSRLLPNECKDRTIWAYYSGHEDFTDIWGTVEEGKRIDADLAVIIWDDTPTDDAFVPVSTGSHLSPIEWAFCARKLNSNIKVLILDLAPKAHATLAAYRFVQSLRTDSIPWLRVVALDQISRCVSVLLSLLSHSSSSATELKPADLLRQIRLQLTEPGQSLNRHALTNIVGGIIIAGSAYFDDRSSLHARPLLTLFKAVGLVPAKDYDEPRTRGFLAPGKYLLLDDQANHGWKQWLRKVLVQGNVESLWDEPDPIRSILARLEREVTRLQGNRFSDLRFSMSLAGRPAPDDDEIMLLDLRLFANGHASASRESEFYACILDYAKQLPDTGAWEPIPADDLRLVQEWCDANKGGSSGDPRYVHDTDAHFAALTLLPRVLALLDMTYPIVLFSSTGRREIIERLAPYGNIITFFEKPRFFGVHPESVRELAVDALRKALDRANEIIRVRKKCRRLGQIASLPERDTVSANPAFDALHVELYVDESGSGPHSVGGCFAVWGAEDLGTAKEAADHFDDDLVTEGLRYFDSLGIGPASLKILNKKDPCSKELDAALSRSDYRPVTMGVLRIRTSWGESGRDTNDLIKAGSIDNRFRFALENLLEIFFTETVPALREKYARNKDVTVSTSIYCATRVKVFDDEEAVQKSVYRWGLYRVTNDAPIVYSLSRGEIYPIISSVLRRHRIAESISVERALAVRLVYDQAKVFYCRRCQKMVTRSVETASVRESSGRAVSGVGVPRTLSGSLSTLRRIQKGDEEAGGIAESERGTTHQRIHLDHTCAEEDLRPDYRALHYLADEILASHCFPKTGEDGPYAKQFSKDTYEAGEFDGAMGPLLDLSLSASRAVNSHDLVQAIVDVPLPLESDQYQAKPPVYLLTAKRVAQRLAELRGQHLLTILSDKGRFVEGIDGTKDYRARISNIDRFGNAFVEVNVGQYTVPGIVKTYGGLQVSDELRVRFTEDANQKLKMKMKRYVRKRPVKHRWYVPIYVLSQIRSC